MELPIKKEIVTDTEILSAMVRTEYVVAEGKNKKLVADLLGGIFLYDGDMNLISHYGDVERAIRRYNSIK